MTAILKVDTIQDTSGNNIINENSNTITIGASGDTISIPSGATITNSGTATGFGKVLQVVNGTVGSTSMANTDDYIGSGLSITPTSASSKIQIFVAGYVEKGGGGAVGNYAELQMREGTTAITTLNNAIQYLYTVGARQNFSINFTRSPNTTSAVQYRLYHNEISGGATYIYYQQAWTLMEIEG